jgi:hypothetical protein
MGREIRRVPPNWEHPRDKNGKYLPLHDQTFNDAMHKWQARAKEWFSGNEEQKKSGYPATSEGFIEWDGEPPKFKWYRPAYTEEPTWFQAYENVSEGTPVSPPFETKDELIDWVAANGLKGLWEHMTREQAERFVSASYGPSMVMLKTPEGVKMDRPFSDTFETW